MPKCRQFIDREIIIQEEIKVSKIFITEIIEKYKVLPKNFSLCMGSFSGNRDKIISEIKKLSKIGKQILLMDYKFEEYLKSNKSKY